MRNIKYKVAVFLSVALVFICGDCAAGDTYR